MYIGWVPEILTGFFKGRVFPQDGKMWYPEAFVRGQRHLHWCRATLAACEHGAHAQVTLPVAVRSRTERHCLGSSDLITCLTAHAVPSRYTWVNEFRSLWLLLMTSVGIFYPEGFLCFLIPCLACENSYARGKIWFWFYKETLPKLMFF